MEGFYLNTLGWTVFAFIECHSSVISDGAPMKGTRSRRRTTVTGARKLVLVRPAEAITMSRGEADCFTCKRDFLYFAAAGEQEWMVAALQTGSLSAAGGGGGGGG